MRTAMAAVIDKTRTVNGTQTSLQELGYSWVSMAAVLCMYGRLLSALLRVVHAKGRGEGRGKRAREEDEEGGEEEEEEEELFFYSPTSGSDHVWCVE